MIISEYQNINLIHYIIAIASAKLTEFCKRLIVQKVCMFEAENKFYEENRETLREKYLGKRVVIVKDKILGVYDSDADAPKTMELGTFCVKYIPVNPAEEIHRLHNFL